MSAERIELLPVADDPRIHAASLHDSTDWLHELRHFELDGATACEQRTDPDTEAFLLVLSGTHDLTAGGGGWLRRGIRSTVCDGGRPVGVFLPPNTPFKLENGKGTAIVMSVRRPEPPEPATPTAVLSKRPLLQMAGSGKAFDPASGTWKPKEAFPESPEAILPRRVTRLDAGGGVTAQRILDYDYKSLGLCVDEVTLAAGTSAHLPEHPSSQTPCEILVYFECEGSIECDGIERTGRGLFRLTGRLPKLTARDGRAYAAITYAGPKAP